MARITSVVWIKVDGQKLNTVEGGTFKFGGHERAGKSADNQAYVGYTQKPVWCEIEVTCLHSDQTDIALMNAWANVTVEVYTDTGKQYTCAGAALMEAIELSGTEGEMALKFVGPPAQEM